MATRGLREKEKKLNDLHQMILTNMLNEPENKFCAECGVKGPRWASWNLGVFMCIRCSGIHRNLGVHISKVRSVNLDTWRPEWIESIQALGNHKAAQIWEYHLPRDFKRPADNDQEMEAFIRAKYERSRFKRRPEDPALESDVRPAGVASAPAAVAAPVTAAADARKDKKASSSSAHGGPASASAAHHPNASGAHAFAHNGPHSAHHHQHGHGHHAPAQVHPQVHIRSVLPPGGGAAAPGPVIPPATAAAPVAAAPVQAAAPAPAPTKAQTIQDDLFSLLGPAPAAAPASNGAPSNGSSDFFTQSSQSLQESKHAAKMNDIMSLFNSAPSQPAGGFNNNINNNMGGPTSTASNANMNALNSVFGAPAAAIPPQQYQQQQQPFQQQQMGGYPPGFGMPPPQQHQQQPQQPFGMQGFPGYGQPAQPQQHYQQQPQQQQQPFGASPFGANPFGAAPAPAPAAGYNPFAMQATIQPTPAAYARPPTQGSGITLDTSLWQ